MHIFLFFRDFRLTDNTGLIKAIQKYRSVIPVFVFTPEQIVAKKNPYFGDHSVQFLCESLEDLAMQIKVHKGKLYIFYGELEEVLKAIHKKVKVHSLSFNKDYTPYARRRTEVLQRWCKEQAIAIGVYEDYLLRPVGSFVRDNGKAYHIYTSFKKKVEEQAGLIPRPNSFQDFAFERLASLEESCYSLAKPDRLYKFNEALCLKGGREEGKRLLAHLPKNHGAQGNGLSFTTSHLSAYIKYGAVSVREVFYAFIDEGKEALRDQLIWREFYTYIAYYFPEVLKGAYWQKKYMKIAWEDHAEHLKAWQEGKTGYPIVDACMRELNTTGYMDNRGRMICANFLNRLLHIDWRRGERYFAQKLIDYDPAVNNGNWQWVASTGVDPKPYFQRVFNPFLQSKRYDPDGCYIKKWLPQLADVPAKALHAWDQHYYDYNLRDIDYYAPIVAYKKARARSLAYYKYV